MASSLSAAGVKIPFSAASVADATDELLGMRLNEGLNLIDEKADAGLQISVRATTGELLEYVVTDLNGCEVDPIIDVSVASKKKTTCWKCGKDSDGNTHCWQVPCPVIVGPWIPGKVITSGFILA